MLLAAWFLVSSVFAIFATKSTGPKNVLFLVSDDMRPEMTSFYHSGAYPSHGTPEIHTPHLESLASRSLLLRRAYAQYSSCCPSRSSFLTGRRPETTGVHNIKDYFRNVGGDFVTIPQYFKQNGYHTVGMGKVFHTLPMSGGDDPISWSEDFYHAPNYKYWAQNKYNSWQAVSAHAQRQHPLPDQQIANHAIDTMRRLVENSEQQPFFLAVGFHKPHLPMTFPDHFLEYYPTENIRLPLNPFPPVHFPEIAWSKFGDLRSYDDIGPLSAGAMNTTLPPEVVLALRRAYYCAVTYVDSLVGEVLEELDALGLRDNTIVTFLSDHGYQLGEHGQWTKHTNFELATRVPLMVRVPGLTDSGVVTDQLAELVDIFPTLVEAANLPELPLCPEHESRKVALCREGTSLLPLIRHPEKLVFKSRVFSSYTRYKHIGISMRTDRFRYTEWYKFCPRTMKTEWSDLRGVELYDHVTDPDENYNMADEPMHRPVREELSQHLREGWRAAVPP